MPVCSTCGTSYGATVRICVRDGTPLLAGRADDPYLGALLDDKYRIETFISAGGMGSVYRARHVMLGKTVAVKVIRNELVTSDEIVARFQREARAASNLNHPNIVTVHDLGQASDGTLYIAMEFIDGASLRDTIRREGPFPPARIVDILRQVAGALAAAHRKQIVHRDLKSHNLMLASDDRGRDVVKLVDFGIAKTFDEATQLTVAGYMLGTPHYMSPEQAGGKAVDHRADIYSLGVILYEMLTGAVPFADDSLPSVLTKLATEVPPRPSVRRPGLGVSPVLEAVAMRCLEKDPGDRFQSADQFADALEGTAAPAGPHVATEGTTQFAPLLPAAAPASTMLAEAATLVRPHAQGARAVSEAPAGDGIPIARVRSGFSLPAALNGRVAAIVAGIAAVLAIAIASGIALSRAPESNQNTQERKDRSPTLTTATTAATPRSDDGADATVPTTSVAPESPAVPGSPNADNRRPDIPAKERSVRASATSPVASEPVGNPPRRTASAAPTLPATRDQVSSAPAQAEPVASPPLAPAAPPQAVPSAVVVSVACDGFPDVCSVIRTEMVRAFQRAGIAMVADRAPADVGIIAAVTLVSETASAEFGSPMLTRTYSVELTGDSPRAMLVMPPPRRFSYDARFGDARLEESARLIGADAVESVRAFLAQTAAVK
jgi:serine/threonine-protein kinase